ncbi:hypothetical protein [Duganella sp. BJB1802]|uniref:hypothetical protein n=1 Tax=Duganella sp. BJB1802 TaxID=2744575 RepID=UPI001E5C4EDA|nr:hypothetical protein [Duganella sp. BJB1802]
MVSVENPACIKGFGHSENIRNKNDAIDAGLDRSLLRNAACALESAAAGTAPVAAWTQRSP